MKTRDVHIAIAKYPKVQLTAVHGLTDMFLTANRFIAEPDGDPGPRFSVSHWGLSGDPPAVALEYATATPAPRQQDVLVLPGSLDEQMPAESRPLIDWVLSRYRAGAVTCSVCKGAFVLALCGILDGRRVTTHWALEEAFAARFPRVQLQIDKILIDDGDIVTAGGVMAWLDLGLNLVHRFAGPQVMLAVAKYLLIDPHGREQQFYRAFSPPLNHGDEKLVKVQHWLQANVDKSLSLDQLAAVAGVSVRTLIRRFRSALNMTPTTYIQHIRVEKARELLAFTTQPVSQIAWNVGYEDPSAFGKLFHKTQGLSPGEYRRRFAVG